LVGFFAYGPLHYYLLFFSIIPGRTACDPDWAGHVPTAHAADIPRAVRRIYPMTPTAACAVSGILLFMTLWR